VGSIHLRKVVRVGRDGAVRELVPAGRDGLGSAQGMEVDAARRILWVCGTANKQARGVGAAEVGRAALHAFHADSGKPLGRYPLAGGEAGHSCDSLTLDRQGAVYVSDAVTGAVYRLPRGGKALEAFLPAGTLLSSQSPTFAADGKVLFIADYARGVMRVDVATRKAGLLPAPPDAFLAGIDGLVFHGGSLYAVQNGVNPTRVLRLRLAPGLDRVAGVDVLARNLPLFDDPTLAMVAEGNLYYIANSHWGRFDDAGNLKEPEKLSQPAVLKIPLEGGVP
jgi:streptogramin lyase